MLVRSYLKFMVMIVSDGNLSSLATISPMLEKGNLPNANTYKTTPKLQTSAAGVSLLVRRASGDI